MLFGLSVIEFVIYSISVFIICGILVKSYLHSIHMFQIEHYAYDTYYKWYKKRIKDDRLLISDSISIIILAVFIVFPKGIMLLIVLIILSLLKFSSLDFKKQKKRLKYTNRMKRLIIGNIILLIITYLLIYLFTDIHKAYIILYAILIHNMVVYALPVISNLCLTPIEFLDHRKYLKQAEKKISKNPFLTRVGITGSYGKTSTKVIAYNILKTTYNTCKTPDSFNTPMGITRTINNRLKNIDEVFVCEMGACRKGEIKELCDIAKPHIGILTAIGPQHLDTMRTMKNIQHTKFELIESLPSDGLAILNYDNHYIRSYTIQNKVKTLTYGIDEEDLDYRAKAIKYNAEGCSFTVVYPDDREVNYKTKLLGKHNIYNLLASIILADHMKLDVRKVQHAVRSIKPIEHRLELKIFDGFNIIDDAFNSNPEGSSNALEILNSFNTKKVIITPGMIELGDQEYQKNYQFGEKIAQICDFVVLVGKKQTEAIYKGLVDSNYPKEQIYLTNDFEDGFNKARNQYSIDSTILIENDLPDNYNERN